MLEHDPTDPVDLHPFRDAAATHLRRRLAAYGATPDLCGVVTRARELSPTRIPAAMVAAAEARTPASVPEADGDEALAAFTGALRNDLEARLSKRRMAPVLPPRTRMSRWWFAGAAAAAAAIVLAFVMVGTGRLSATPSPSGDLAIDSRSPAADHEAINGDRTWAPRRPIAVVPSETSPPEPVPTEVEPEAGDTDGTAHDEARRSPSPDDLTQWAKQAQALWRAGDLRGAEALFQRIVRRGGRSRHAELAYADLFAIARRLHDENTQARLWRAYLRRFPRGRLSEDTRARLCRLDTGAKQQACWRRYLASHPDGAHAAEAHSAKASAARASTVP